jgi:dienelactone hydrolase
MRYGLPGLVVAVLMSAGWNDAQGDIQTLYRGHSFTEEEAAARHREFAASYANKGEWEHRAAAIRAGIRQGLDLEKLPEKPPVNPIRHSKRDFDGYSVENVAIESAPGFWMSANLYLPHPLGKSHPAILSAHGHWENGRTREDMQLRCAAFARMGAVVFAWDMVGYGESSVYEHHHAKALRPHTWNSMRALDFVLSLEYVDAHAVAVTGASGGATQAFLLAALDDRIAVSAPVCQVSAHFYGGCACESAMPIHKSAHHDTSNVEIAALFAPKPQILVSNGADWTKNNPEVEFPYVRNVYTLYGREAAVEHAHFPDEVHDYGFSKRDAVYRFLARHLGLKLRLIQDENGAVREDFVSVLKDEELHVFDEDHPRPGLASLKTVVWWISQEY